MKNEADKRTRPNSSRLLTEPGRPLMELAPLVRQHRHDDTLLALAASDIRFGSSAVPRIGSRTTNFSAAQQATMLEWLTMRISGYGTVGAVRRKMRAPSAVGKDPGVTDHEKTNAEGLKTRLKQRLREAEAPAGDCDRRSLW